MSKTLSCGRDLTCVPDLKLAVEEAAKDGFDFVQVPLFHPLFKRDHPSIIHRQGPPTRNDTILTGNDWAVLIVAKLSPWIQLESEDPAIRRQSEDGFFQEVSLAIHLGVPAILISLSSPSCVNLARCLYRPLLTSIQIYWVKVPVVSPRLIMTDVEEDDNTKQSHSIEDPWEWWNTLRTLCGNNSKLHLVLEVGSVLPSYAQQLRWLGEPVKAVSIATGTFTKNHRGYPVLAQKHREFIYKLLKLNVQVILTGYSKVDYPMQNYLSTSTTFIRPSQSERHSKPMPKALKSTCRALYNH
ncbi:Protein arginine N-methyltransferase 5 [Geodia barretti]|uniref:Protein arginine N-methyltransferase 5 n=2 Tax=Geodia barretti TaxID=519541 RepID=A0AA35T7I5_GEOBA|nr:Protein arginine N-methyltransferase 5 [Geodia barretti]